MWLRDCVRLGVANIAGNRRRCVLVVVITGVMFALIFAGFEVIAGLETATQVRTTEFMNGQVLLRLTIEDKLTDSKSKLTQKVTDYGGYTEPVEEYQFDEMLYLHLFPVRLKASLEDKLLEANADGAVPILISADEAGKWQRLMINEKMGMEQRLEVLTKVRERSLGKVIENNGLGVRPDIEKTRFFVAGLLPASLTGVSLSLSNIGDAQNPFNIVLESIPTGGSETFVLERLSEEATNVKDNELWAVFPNVEMAYDFVMERQICSNMNETCVSEYRYSVREVISNPLEVKMSFRGIWKIYTLVWLILTAIGVFITVSTYTRLINQEVRNIALYRALGATVKNVYAVYAMYLVVLSLLTMAIALGMGTLLALLMSGLCRNTLSADFAISFGAELTSVRLIGWNDAILAIIVINVIVALASAGVNILQFSATKVAQKLKG